MNIERLSLFNFKNYREATLEFDAGMNIFTGLNGQGKTNLLDAIHYLSFCKSYFNPIDVQNIRHGEEFFVVEGEFAKGESTDKIYCGVKRGRKKVFRKNREEYARLAEHIGQYPSVVISPYDKDLISEGSETRRKFMDSIIAQYNRVYLDKLIAYNKTLRHRNALLKYFWENRVFEPDNLLVWDAQLTELAEAIHTVRVDFISTFLPIFREHYAAVSGAGETVAIDYRSDLNKGSFGETLSDGLAKDRRTQYTNVGTHKDDLRFQIGGHPLKKFGSQGQQKTFLIALKLAQFDLVKSATGRVPVLLLDDVFDKIDDLRVRHLMDLVGDGRFGQIFITDTHESRVEEIIATTGATARVFAVENGEVYEPQRQ